MKKFLLFTIAAIIPFAAQANNKLAIRDFQPYTEIPSQFASSSETSIMEWGCPVSEVVEAESSIQAVEKIGKECMEQAKKAANAKPGVFEVIEVSVIWPDIQINEQSNGFHLQGTFFLETLVLQGAQ